MSLRGDAQSPGERDSDGSTVGWGWAEPTSGVTADRFELWRAMTGRRSAEQVASWEWTGETAVERLCLLPARPTPLVE